MQTLLSSAPSGAHVYLPHRALPSRGHQIGLHYHVWRTRRSTALHIAKAYTEQSWRYRCPYEALGVNPGADESSIRRAYRLKCKQYHPDLNKAENAEMKFITIGEAYEFLVSRFRGKEVNDGSRASGNSSAFHDWYWTFRMSRTWERQQKSGAAKAGQGPAFASQPETKEELRGQILGLHQRAAMRRQRAATSSEHVGSTEQQVASSEAQGTCPCAEGAAAQDEANKDTDLQQEPAFFSAMEGPSDSGDPDPPCSLPGAGGEEAQQQHSTGRRRFMGSPREQLTGQLMGVRRKAVLKQQMQQAQAW